MANTGSTDDGSLPQLPNGSGKDHDRDEENMQKLAAIAISTRLPQQGYDAINALKKYGPKAISYMLDVAKRAMSILVRRYALRVISDLK